MRQRPILAHAATLALSIAAAVTAAHADAAVPIAWRDTFMANGGEYDIRTDAAAAARLASFGAKAATLDSIPEVFDVPRGAKASSMPAGGDRVSAARAFLHANRARYGLSADEVEALVVVADDHAPDRALSFVRFAQQVGDLPVFAAEITVAFDADGHVFRTVGRIVPGVAPAAKSAHFGDVQRAISSAAGAIGYALPKRLAETGAGANGTSFRFERGPFAAPVTAEAMWFPLASGVVRPAWRVLLAEDVLGFYVIVDAETNEMLWRTNLTHFQTQAASYSFYNAASPAPIFPGPNSPSGQQAPLINRIISTRIGNEAPYTFNNNGWITDNDTSTAGNAVVAGVDRDLVNGIDANGSPVNTFRVFNFAYNPSPGSPEPGTEPAAGTVLTDFQAGVVTHAFYWANVFHDEMYRLGFTEQARNHQADNFGRGGVAGDRVTIEVQDSSGANNANAFVPADGAAARVQMYLWTAPTPDRDGALDTTVLLHELTHTMTKRLIGNGTGLTLDAGQSMNEGWSDYFAAALLASPADPSTALYTLGSYSTLGIGALGTNNNYYGIRRFPIARLSATGGPSNRPHNPLTFIDVDPAQVSVSDGAYPQNPAFLNNTSIQAKGEFWAVVLWEIRARLIDRLGFATGSRRAMQMVVDGMKLTPTQPRFLDARDAILAVAAVSGDPNDLVDARAGFALRGMGPDATEVGTAIREPMLSDGFE